MSTANYDTDYNTQIPSTAAVTGISDGSVTTESGTTYVSSSRSSLLDTESSTTVYENHFSDPSDDNLSISITSTTSINNSYFSAATDESPTEVARQSESWSHSTEATLNFTDDSTKGEVGREPSSAPIVLIIIFLLILAVVAILLYIRYRRKIRWCKPNNELKDIKASDNGFVSRHVQNEMELNVEKGESSLLQTTKPPPPSDDLIELRTLSEQPNATLPTINESKEASPTYYDPSKPPPLADRTTETPPSSRQKRKTRTTSCQLAYVPPPADEDFMDCIKRHQENLILYQKEFDCLPDGSVKSSSVARSQQNIVKNRYVNVLPYDYNRVILPKKSEDESDFINASFIDGAIKKNAYISTQGPLSSTLQDFWSMIWNNNCHRIVMLTNLEESIRSVKTVKTSKCTQYWPSALGQHNTYGDIEVKFLKESIELDWTIRTLEVKKEGCETTRTVQQYHYTTWPDQDVPHTSTAILKFHRLALQSKDTDDSAGPVVVHCSAGVGRTGTLIAIDILAENWKETQPQCDVFKCVQNLRQQRMSMVQSVRQYMFIHHSLIQEFRIGVSVEQTVGEALQHRHSTEQLQEQFKILEATSVISIPHCSVSKSKPKKNRTSTILPTNSLIRFLKPVNEDDNLYINAVPVKGFRESNAFFVTQMPLTDTINDFWRLVNDNRCRAIVMLNSSFNDDERYWPLDDDVMKIKSFLIKRTGNSSVLSRDGLVTTDLDLQFIGTYKKTDDSSSDDESTSCDDSDGRRSGSQDLEGFDFAADPNQSPWRRILHLRVSDWPETQQLPSDAFVLLHLYDQVIQLRARHPTGYIIIQCTYGAARCGMFCALVNILDRLADQGTVGVFDAVKLVKGTRQQFVPDFEHYDYLHRLVNIYLTKRKEKNTDVYRDVQTTKQEKEPTGQKLTESSKQASVAEDMTGDRKISDDQKITKERQLLQEQGIKHKESGSIGVTQDAAMPNKEGGVAKDVKEQRDIAIVQQIQDKGNIQDSKEPQRKGNTENMSKESKRKETAPVAEESTEKCIGQAANGQKGNEIIHKPEGTGNTQDSDDREGKGTPEDAKELKEKETAPAVKATQEKGIALDVKKQQQSGTSQRVADTKENGIIPESQEKAMAISDQLSQEEANVTNF